MSDVVGWLLLSVVTALSASAFIPLDIAMKVAGVLAFIGTAWWGVRPFLERFVATQMGGGEGADHAAADAGGGASFLLDPRAAGQCGRQHPRQC